MNRCPDIYELNVFFGGSHVQLDPDAPEAYSTHRFERVTENERIVCELLPAEYELNFIWWVSGRVALDLKLKNVQSLDISRSAGDATLIGNVDSEGLQQLFKLQVKPSVCLKWTTTSFYG